VEGRVRGNRSVWVALTNQGGWPAASIPPIDGEDFLAWGAQLEAQPFPTSFVATTGAIATRAADKLILNSPPDWLSTGKWQIDVQPLFGSSEMRPGWRYTLLSFDAGNEIVLVNATGSSTGARLELKTGSATRLSLPLTWARGQVLHLTFDPSQDLVTALGATTGNGTYSTVGEFTFPRSPIRIGGVRNGSGEAFAAISEPRKVEKASESCVPPRNACAPECPCEAGSGATSAAQCEAGLTIKAGVAERFGLPADYTVCWDPICDTAEGLLHCGTVQSLCGLCPPAVQCTNDSQCAGGETCGENNGWRFGLAGRVCWSEVCEDKEQITNECGNALSLCGLCADENDHPAACVPDCYGRTCGGDGCGGRCGPQCPKDNSPDNDAVPTTVGNVDVHVDVGIDGDARVSIPLQVAPGRQGITPALGLSYNSGGGYGPLGVGWALDGLSQITVCRHTANGSTASGPKLQWGYCLDGERLVPFDRHLNVLAPLVGFTDNSVTSYHPERDPSIRVDHVETSWLGLESSEIWVIGYRDGRRAILEDLNVRHSQARQNPAGLAKGLPAAWWLTRLEDRFGNYYKVSYTVIRKEHSVIPALEGQTGGQETFEVYPKRIDYTGHRPSGLAPTRSVRFEYARAVNPDGEIVSDYVSRFLPVGLNRNTRSGAGLVQRERDGLLLRIGRQLQKITMFVGGSAFKQYRLKYERSPSSGRPRLKSLLDCSGTTQASLCKPPVTLGWSEASARMPAARYKQVEQYTWGDKPGFQAAADVDGDGRSEILFSQTGNVLYPFPPPDDTRGYTGTLHIVRNIGGTPEVVDTGVNIPKAQGGFFVVDMNGDGRDDVAYRMNAEGNEGKMRLVMIPSEYTPEGYTYKRHVQLDVVFPPFSSNFGFVELNGDGHPDLIYCAGFDDEGTHGTWRYREADLEQGKDFSEERDTGFGCVSPQNTRGGYEQVFRSDLVTAWTWSPRATVNAPLFVDMDGDGVDELVWKDGTKGDNARPNGIYGHTVDANGSRSYNLRSGIPPEMVNSSNDYAVYLTFDINGDGLADVMKLQSSENPFTAPDVNDSHDVPVVFFNNGNTFLPPTRAFESTEARALLAFIGATALDWNGDGRAELLVPSLDEDNQWRWKIFTANEDARLKPIDVQLPLAMIHEDSRTPIVPLALRAPGARANDLATALDSTQSTSGFEWQIQSTPKAILSDLVTSVDVGVQVGKSITHLIEYSTTADPEVYEWRNPTTGGADECMDGLAGGFPFACLRSLTLVKSLVLKTGNAKHEHTRRNYLYRTGRVHLHGRGFIGFEAREISFPKLNERHVEWFNNWTTDEVNGLPIYRGVPLAETRAVNEGAPVPGPGSFDVGPWFEWVGHTLDFRLQKCEGQDFCSDISNRVYAAFQRTTEVQAPNHVSETDRWIDEHGSLTSVYVSGDYESRSHVTTFDARTDGWTAGGPLPWWDVARPKTIQVRSDAFKECTGTFRVCGDHGCHEYCRELFPDESASHTSTYEYDDQGVLQQVIGDVKVAFTYDPYGNITTQTVTGEVTPGMSPDVRVTTTVYEGPGETEFTFPRQQINAAGHTTVLGHHPFYGTVTSETFDDVLFERELDGFGRIKKDWSTQRGEWTTYDYLEGVSYPKVKVTEGGGPAYTITHDALGRKDQERVTMLNGRERVRSWKYNDLGQLEHVTLPHFDGETETIDEAYTYDAIGRLSTRTHADTYFKVIQYRDNEVHVTDERSQTRVFYRQGEHVTRVVDPAVDGVSAETHYWYGVFGELRHIIDAAQNTTTIDHDNYGRVVRVDVPGVGATRHRYNAFGELEKSENVAAGWSKSFYRDSLGRSLRVVTGSGHEDHFQWDDAPHGLGKLHVAWNSEGARDEYAYDAAGRASGLTSTLPNHTFTQAVLARDEFGRVTQRKLPDGPDGRTFRLRYAYDQESGRLEGIFRIGVGDVEAPIWALTEEHGNGTIKTEQFGNNVKTTWGIDPTRQLLSSITTEGPQGVVQNVKYGRDATGNITSRTDNLKNGLTEVFALDAVGRLDSRYLKTKLTGSIVADSTQDYAYDVLGNLTLRAGQVLRYEDGLRPHAVTAASGLYETGDIGYDKLGRLIEKGPLHVDYNDDSQPTRMWTEGAEPNTVDQEATFVYGPDGSLRQRTASGMTDSFVGREYELHETAVGATHRYHIWNESRAVATVEWTAGEDINAISYLHADHLGSVVASTEGTGPNSAKLKDKFSYEAFGSARSPEDWKTPSPMAQASFGFTGYQQNDLGQFGIVRAGARLYDPELARFYQADSVISEVLNSQDLNLYSYVHNKPTSLVDPSGMMEYGATAVVERNEIHPFADQRMVPDIYQDPLIDNGKAGNRHQNTSPVTRDAARSEPPQITGQGRGTPKEPNQEATSEDPESQALQDALLGLGEALGMAVAETIIPGVGLYNDLDTLFDDESSTAEKVIAGVSVIMDVAPVPKITAAIKGIGAVAGATAAVVKVVKRAGNAKAVGKVADVAETVAKQADEVMSAAEHRAREVHQAVSEATQRRTTIAVTETEEGISVVSSSEKRLRPSQREMLGPNEIEGIGPGHAEVTGVNAARARGLTPTGTGASRPICGECGPFLQSEGVNPLSPLK
jgi:RHS repeat-associated protein